MFNYYFSTFNVIINDNSNHNSTSKAQNLRVQRKSRRQPN